MTPVPFDPDLERARETARLARSLGWRGGWISDAEAYLARALCAAPAPEPEPAPTAPRILPAEPPEPVRLYASRPTRYSSRRAAKPRNARPARVDDFLDRWGESRRRTS